MANIEIKNAEGQSVGTLELAAEVYGIEPNINVTHQVVTCQRASLRQGTHKVKNRHEVSGGGRKPYRQKGTGRARQGSIRAGQWTGGGVIFGPQVRSHARRTNKKEVKLAMRSVLSGKVRDEELILLDQLTFEKPSTKQAAELLKALEVADKRVTVVVADDDINAYLSFRNLEKVEIITAHMMNTYDFLDNKNLVLTEKAVEYIEGVLA